MWLSNRQRVTKLFAALISSPTVLPRYVAHLPAWKRPPLASGQPWWSYGAIDFLATRITPNMTVFEFGTGGSTIFLARRCRALSCVENHPMWYGAVQKRLREKELSNCTITLCPLPTANSPASWEHYLSGLSKPYDVIVIDGFDPVEFGKEGTYRKVCFARAEEIVRPGGFIVVDDSWRYTSLRSSNRATSVHVFEGVGPCRVGVTSTDVYCY